MFLAAQQIPPVAIAVGIATIVALAVIALLLFRGYERLAKSALRRAFRGIEIHEQPQAGDVIVTYHTYHGLLVWFTQTQHQVALQPDDARQLLGRLLRFNLSWGLFTYGALFIPPLSFLNYRAQRRSIAAQEATGR